MLRYWFVPFAAWIASFILFWNVRRWRQSVALTVLMARVWAVVAAAPGSRSAIRSREYLTDRDHENRPCGIRASGPFAPDRLYA